MLVLQGVIVVSGSGLRHILAPLQDFVLFCFMTTTMASTTATTNTDCYVLGPNNPVRDIVHISYVSIYIYTSI